jgi:ComF family protein
MEEFLDSGPRAALLPGISISAETLCPGCWSRLDPAPAAGSLSCPFAGAGGVPIVSPFHTNDELLALVRFLKFSGGRTAVPALGWWMAAALGDHLGAPPGRDSLDPVLVPVPLHPLRLKARGYNQATLLAREIAGRLGLEVDSGILARIRNTKAQSTIDRERRSGNVSGAFGLDRGELAAGRDLILVDDLVTTGETAKACVAALEGTAARSIAVLAAGRARD